MNRGSEKTIVKGLFLIVLFYTVVQHFEAVKNGVLFCYNMISPLICGAIIAFIINLIVAKLEKYMTKGPFKNIKVRRTTSIILSLVILVGVVVIIVSSLIPGVVESVKQIAEKVPGAMDKFIDFLEMNFEVSDKVVKLIENFEFNEQTFAKAYSLVENQSLMEAIKASGAVVGNVVSDVAKFFIGLFFAFYILANKEAIGSGIRRAMHTYLPERVASGTEYVAHIIYETYANFISGQCVDAIILGCMVMIGMGILGLPYPVLIGVIVAVTALVPVVGGLFGGLLGILLIVMDSPIKALTFVVLFMVLQQIDNRLIYPYVVGNAIGIPSMLIFVGIVIGAQFGGVVGMFMGIPFIAVIYTLLKNDMEKRGTEPKREDMKPL